MPWRVGGHVSWMTLGGLPPERAATMMSSLADGALPGALMERLLALADGIPLFIEELARMDPQALFQHPDQARPDLGQAELRTIPPGVHELLLARLDLLGPAEKELARIAATIGRQFSHTLLARCAHAEEQALLSGVHQLVRHGVLDREGSPPAETYRFRHVLLQEAIRLSLLKHQRQQYRAEVVRALQELQPSRTDVLLPT